MKTFKEFVETRGRGGFGFGVIKNQPMQPAASLNSLAGNMADNILTLNITVRDAKSYIERKAGESYPYVAENIFHHIARRIQSWDIEQFRKCWRLTAWKSLHMTEISIPNRTQAYISKPC